MFEVTKEKVEIQFFMTGFATQVRRNGKRFIIFGQTCEDVAKIFKEIIPDGQFNEKHVQEITFGQTLEQQERRLGKSKNFLYNKDNEFSVFRKV